MIPAFDYLPEYRRIEPEIDAAIRRVLDSGRVILGPEVEAFEREFAAHVGVGEAVGVNSGTDAIVLALRALGIGEGDEVLTVANAGVPPVAAIRAAGATPRFVDVDETTLLLDPALLADARSPRTRGILPVHLYGRPAAMNRILAFAAEHDLAVVEDCAQAHGASHEGRPVGSLGRIGCFSFYPTKNLGAYGDGGICVTDDADLAARLRMLRMYGYRGDGHAHLEGLNSRLDELQAAILRVKLTHLEANVGERRALARRYRAALGAGALRLPDDAAGEHAYHLFVVRVPDRPRREAALRQAAIGYGVHYPEPVHLMEGYAFLGCASGDLPVTEAACASVLSLPLYPGLAAEAVDRVAATLLAAP